MTLISEIEYLGVLMDAGEIDHQQAVSRIVEFAEGGLTTFGAADLLARHTSVRAEYEKIGDTARENLRGMGLLP